MRLVTSTEADMPEGMIEYDAEEVIRKALISDNVEDEFDKAVDINPELFTAVDSMKNPYRLTVCY